MTKEELKSKMEDLEEKFNLQKIALYKRFAYENNPYKIGDIIEDSNSCGRIKSIGVYVSSGLPQCFYRCENLLKDKKTISKKLPFINIYQQNIIEHENS